MNGQSMDGDFDESELPSFEIDPALLPLGDVIAGLLPKLDLHANESQTMEIEEIEIDVPLELDVQAWHGRAAKLSASPPVYYVETSDEPVLHQMKITIQKDLPQLD
jgi:hypothetical protein